METDTDLTRWTERLDTWRRRLKLTLENRYYAWRHGRPIRFQDFVIHENRFSGRRLEIIYLLQFIVPYQINNTLKPLEHFGTVHTFELDPEHNRRTWYQRKRARNREMVAFVTELARTRHIDVIVCYLTGFSTNLETLEALRALGIPMINESLDDERKFISRRGKDGLFRGLKNICRYFDLSLTTSRSAIVKYLVEGARPMYKPYAGNPEIYRPLSGSAKHHDVGFVGGRYGTRAGHIEWLRQNGIAVHARGEDWGDGAVSTEDMVRIFCESKIVLGFAGVGKSDDICILKGRDFEVPLTGSFYLTQYHDELLEYFEPGKDIETWRDREEMLDKVRYYLAHDTEREAVARCGYEKCRRLYTTDQSYAKVFGMLGL